VARARTAHTGRAAQARGGRGDDTNDKHISCDSRKIKTHTVRFDSARTQHPARVTRGAVRYLGTVSVSHHTFSHQCRA
jgi:hypothetical protein